MPIDENKPPRARASKLRVVEGGKSPPLVDDIIADDAEEFAAAYNSGATGGRATKPPKRASSKPKRVRSQHSFAIIRLHWLPIVERHKADVGLRLLAAIAYQMEFEPKHRVAITERTWELAGGASKMRRRTMLHALRRLPPIVRLEYRKRTGSKYAAHKGPEWDAPSKGAGGNEK
jgi:hypothetical protein